MRPILLLLGFIASLNLIGQTNGFNLRLVYGLSTSYSNIWEQDSTYIITGLASDTVDGYLYIRLLATTLTHDGNVVNHKYLGNQNVNLSFGFNASDRLSEDKVVLAGPVSIDGVSLGLVFQLDNLGDTLSSFTFSSPSFTGDHDSFSNWLKPLSLSMGIDGTIYVACQIASEETGNDFAVFSFSLDGQQNWCFISATNLYNTCRDVEAEDDGVWVSVSSFDSDTEWGDIQSFLKFDIGGNVISEVNLEQSNHDICIEMEIVDDGIVGITSYEDGSSLHAVPVIFKVNFNGDYVWTSPYPTSYEQGQIFRDLVRCEDGSGFVAVGEIFDPSPDNPDLDGNYNWYGLLAKYSNEGQEIWSRQYFILQSIQDKHRVVDLSATLDDGYIFCGEATGTDSQNPDLIEPMQQGWVVKVDGCGCLVPDCDPNCSTKDEEEDGLFIDSDQQFVVGPVPADWFINVHVLNDEYLDSRRIEIHNLLGQQVLSYSTPTGQATYMIDTQSLSSGIYIVSMTEHGRVVQSEKVEVR
jgi:hypothetical protein